MSRRSHQPIQPGDEENIGRTEQVDQAGKLNVLRSWLRGWFAWILFRNGSPQDRHLSADTLAVGRRPCVSLDRQAS